ncbi:MAG: hypothetical protein IPM69_04800 [Ignavibacteria bacterium]|nr:hypothetical protein [Ignavibacteria bacterium]
MKIRLILIIILTICLSSCFKNPTDIDVPGQVVITDPASPIMVKPGKVSLEGRHIINSTTVKLEVGRFITDSAKLDTNGKTPYIWLKGECAIALIGAKPPQPNLLNVALQNVVFRIDSLPLSEIDSRLRNSPLEGSGMSFLIRKSIIRRDGGGKEFRDTSSQTLATDRGNAILATARLINTFNTSAQHQHQYLIEISFHMMIKIDDKGIDDNDEDEYPIVGKLIIPINY